MWAFNDRTKQFWNTSQFGDLVAFYVTSPISKVIGFGKLTKKYFDDELVWPDEILFGRPIWKYRMLFDILYLTDDWANGIPVPQNIMLNTGRKVIDERTFSFLLDQANEKWHKKVSINSSFR